MNNKPGSFGFHELVDRTYVVADLFENFVSNHEALKYTDLQPKVQDILDRLWRLYNQVSTMHSQEE